MLEKKNARAVSFAPFRARPSVSLATWRISVWTLPGSSFVRSSKVNIRSRILRAAPARLRDRGDELVAQRLLDVFERFLLHRLHAQHAVDDVDREVVREDR